MIVYLSYTHVPSTFRFMIGLEEFLDYLIRR